MAIVEVKCRMEMMLKIKSLVYLKLNIGRVKWFSLIYNIFSRHFSSIFVCICTVYVLNSVVSKGSFPGPHFQWTVLNNSKKLSYMVELIDNLSIGMLLASLAKLLQLGNSISMTCFEKVNF